jgi:hypothetical protein
MSGSGIARGVQASTSTADDEMLIARFMETPTQRRLAARQARMPARRQAPPARVGQPDPGVLATRYGRQSEDELFGPGRLRRPDPEGADGIGIHP